MSLSDLASLGNLVGGIAVLASLAYLALQVRQNTKHTRALIYTNRATRVQDFNLRMCHASDTTLDACLAGGRADSNMNDAYLLRFYSFCRASYFDAQDTFRQHQEGLLSKDAYEGLIAVMRTRFSEPGMRAGWAVQRDTFSAEFRTLMDQLVEDAHNTPSVVVRLRIALASEVASSSKR
jgi:hypothetical protein